MEIRLVAEVGDIDYERVTLPAADCIAAIELNVLRQMRTVCDRNDPREPGSLADVVVDRHGIRRLNELHDAAERASAHHDRQLAAEATFRTATVLGTIRAIDPIKVVVRGRLGPSR